MKIPCSWTLDRLSDHLDGALDARDRDLVESHLGDCPECSAILDDLREIALAAARLPNREPITDLWGGIATRIGAAAPATGTMTRRFSLSVMQLVAAGIALILFTSAVVWLVRPNAAGDREVAAVAQPGTGGAFSYVARAVAPGSDAAIAELERLLEQARDQLDPATVQVLETNLAIQGNRLNVITKKVTSWAAIIAVPTAVTGFYGQNVPYPGYGQWYGFVTSTLVTLLLALGFYVTFKRKGWL